MTTYENLSNRVALVTGAASGMGEATALLLAASGAKVALLARRLDRLTELAEKITANGGQAIAVAADVADKAAVSAAAERVHDHFGPVDLLVNAAGVMLPNPITDGRDDQWTRMIDTNLTGVLRVTDAFLPDLLAAAEAGRTADLVNISSVGAHLAFQNYAVYCATKAALTHWSASIRTELGPKNVRVTNIEPGLVDTELADHLDPKMAEELATMFDGMAGLSSTDIADLIGFATSRPKQVNLRQVMVLPTNQA
ncbi:MAG TPA: SDR family oxidoreductase [Pseudonocardiaceae bacterium]|jgi:NADP-dependent 3-hydroxy acid dehydrogenase YdfG|nr:SDR family oxidoreductase [Pseudonocardiaceae bacterium]